METEKAWMHLYLKTLRKTFSLEKEAQLSPTLTRRSIFSFFLSAFRVN